MATGFGTVAGSYAESWVEGGGGSQALGEAAASYANLSWIPFILGVVAETMQPAHVSLWLRRP